jgi:NAD(P)-dependent dehydrogenase (short-subunit alcohol dehydrogenase family)
MLLEGRTAVIYGGGGAIGGAVARAFGREGATVHLAGRAAATLEAVADDIRAAGGSAETAVVDALDERAVDAHADEVAARAGGIDISFNLISHNAVHGRPMHEMALDDFAGEIATMVRTSFLTWRAAARHMVPRGAGVILAFGGSGDPMRDYYIGGTQVAFESIEQMRRQLSAEVGRHGIRVVTLRTGGVPESLPEASRTGKRSSRPWSCRPCSAARPPSRTSASPPSSPRTGRTRSPRRPSTSAAGR